MVKLKKRIQDLALKHGFFQVGFASADSIDHEILVKRNEHLLNWLEQGKQGTMDWLNRHYLLRKNPLNLFSQTKTIVSFAILPGFDYLNSGNNKGPHLAGYARGKDYHGVIRERLSDILKTIEREFPDTKGRVITDTAPMDEKGWALISGLGFIGKNTLLINWQQGSLFHLGEILLNHRIEPDKIYLFEGDCEKCTLCIKACPTRALMPYSLDARLCISYQTIEHKIMPLLHTKSDLSNWIFGCEICQRVCPFNKSSEKGNKKSLAKDWPLIVKKDMQWDELINMTEKDFKEIFFMTPIHRLGFHRFMQNIKAASHALKKEC